MSGWLKAALPRMFGIVLIGLGAGLAANQISPRGLPLIAPPKPTPKAEEFIGLEQAKQLWLSGAAFFLDARDPVDFAAGHIGNAFNLPVQAFAQHLAEIAPMLTRESPLVLYCDGTECDLSHRLTESMRQLGYTNVHLLSNGWSAWRQAGLPITPGGLK
jgi:rhodanese-related sulfurtransferase